MSKTKERVEVFEVVIAVKPDLNGLYTFGSDAWDCGRIQVFVDMQELKDCIGIAMVGSINHKKAELQIFQRHPAGPTWTSTTFVTDLFVVERVKDGSKGSAGE